MSSSCLVLRDSEVHNVLFHLSRNEIEQFKAKITNALIQFSTTEERKYQPDPAVITRPDSGKTLFRTYTSPTGPGVKIVQHPPLLGSTTSASTLTHSQNPTDDKDGAAQRDNTTRMEKKKKKATLHGVIAACDEEGFPKAFMNSDTLTAYRTAMSAMILYAGRKTTAKVVLFGAGKTAIWHVRLILALRGEDIEQITVVNRSIENARELVDQVQQENSEMWKSAAVLRVLDVNGADFKTELRETVAAADVVFCTTGVKAPLFPADYVARQACYISSIGSWQDDMVELDPALLVDASKRGIVVVDNRGDCIENCGDLKQSGLEASQVKELGEFMSASETAVDRNLREGLLLYKSVGVGITDLIAANFIVDLARKAEVGTTIADM